MIYFLELGGNIMFADEWCNVVNSEVVVDMVSIIITLTLTIYFRIFCDVYDGELLIQGKFIVKVM